MYIGLLECYRPTSWKLNGCSEGGLTVAAKLKETSVVCVADGCMPSILMPNGLRKVRKSVLMAWLGVTDFGDFADINHHVGELEEEED